MTTQTIHQPVAIQEFVSGLRKLPESAFSGVEQVLEYMKTSPVEPASIEKYLTWDRQHYTRNLIDKTSLYELMAICWDIGQFSSVHNHRDQNCWMAVPIGRLQVENYRVVSQKVEEGVCQLTPSDVVEMNATHPCAVDPQEPVHRVLNPKEFSARAVSLHVYSRPFDSCVVYSPEQGTCGEIKLRYTTEYGEPSIP
jgi:cysteine dioxygenase